MQIVSDGKIEGKILSIEHIDGLIYRLIAATSSDDNRLFWFSVKGNKALDITSGNWEGSDLIGAGVGELKLSTDLHSLLPKLPHYLASLFGGATVVEKEYDYDKDGKIASTGRGVTNIINRLDKNPLVRNRNVLEWDRSNLPTFTVQVVS